MSTHNQALLHSVPYPHPDPSQQEQPGLTVRSLNPEQALEALFCTIQDVEPFHTSPPRHTRVVPVTPGADGTTVAVAVQQ